MARSLKPDSAKPPSRKRWVARGVATGGAVLVLAVASSACFTAGAGAGHSLGTNAMVIQTFVA